MRANKDCWIVRYMLWVHRVNLISWSLNSVYRERNSGNLRQVGGKSFDLFEQGFVIVSLKRWMRKMMPPAPVTEMSSQAWSARPKSAACEAGAPWLTSEVFTAQLEGADRSRGTGDQIGEVGEGDGLPGADAVDGQTDEVRLRDEDHALAGPDDDRLCQQAAASRRCRCGGVEREQDPVLDLRQLRALASSG